ncbi:hypothetical protein Hanom_Chr05g00426741 [Helianthus anomalus]
MFFFHHRRPNRKHKSKPTDSKHKSKTVIKKNTSDSKTRHIIRLKAQIRFKEHIPPASPITFAGQTHTTRHHFPRPCNTYPLPSCIPPSPTNRISWPPPFGGGTQR